MRFRKPHIIFAIIGILLLIISYLLSGSAGQFDTNAFLSSITQDIAFIILTIVIINWLWALLGGEPTEKILESITNSINVLSNSVQLLNDSKSTGVDRIIAVSGDLSNHKDWLDRLKSANEYIDLMGYTLHVWTKCEKFEEAIENLVEHGVKIRVLMMDETNSELGALMNENIVSTSLEAAKEEIRITKLVFEKIKTSVEKKAYTGSFESRTLKNGLIVCQLCRTDSKLSMVQYLYSVVASQSPLIFIEGDKTHLFENYLNEFDVLWDLSD